MKFRDLCEELKIVKKNWTFNDNTDQGFTIEINDSSSHPILDRIKDRTNIKLNDMNIKLQKGIDLILNKNSKGFFKHNVSYIELTYLKSNFKTIFMIKSNKKYLRISSIFELSYNTDGAFYWNINEFKEDHPELNVQILNLNESKIGCYFIDNLKDDKFYTVEMNEKTNSYDVYISDYNDVYKLEIKG